MLESTIKGKEKAWKPEFPDTGSVESIVQLSIIKKDGNHCVKIVKVEKIDLRNMIQHLNQGESIVIARKHVKEEKPALNVNEEIGEPWYFTHI